MSGHAGGALPGDPASCSALGASLLSGARRLERSHPELSAALVHFGGELQRYAVRLHGVLQIERYAAGLVDRAEVAGRVPAAGRVPTAGREAASRRGRAQACLRRASDQARRRFESLSRSPNAGQPPAPREHAR